MVHKRCFICEFKTLPFDSTYLLLTTVVMPLWLFFQRIVGFYAHCSASNQQLKTSFWSLLPDLSQFRHFDMELLVKRYSRLFDTFAGRLQALCKQLDRFGQLQLDFERHVRAMITVNDSKLIRRDVVLEIACFGLPTDSVPLEQLFAFTTFKAFSSNIIQLNRTSPRIVYTIVRNVRQK